MSSSESKQYKEPDKPNPNKSFKNALYMSLIFVGGGIVFFYLYLFIAYSVRL